MALVVEMGVYYVDLLFRVFFNVQSNLGGGGHEGSGLLNQVSVEVCTFFSLAFECSLHSFIHVYFLPVLNDQHLKYQ